MNAGISNIRKGLMASGFAVIACAALALPVSVSPAMAQGITDNSGMIPFDQAFFAFEVESPLGTLKEVPIWDELEQMLDDPYAFALAPTVAGNPQGWPSYRLTQQRRQSFIFRNSAGQPCAPGSSGCTEVPLLGHVIHPLNYNHSTGEELRLLNIEFAGAPWQAGGPLLPDPIEPGVYTYTYLDIDVSPGAERIEDDEAAADFNSPIAPDDRENCIVSVDQFFSPGPGPVGSDTLPEGTTICGGDPGEPGYLGFGVLGTSIAGQYSTPAVPGGTRTVIENADGTETVTVSSIVGLPLFDPVRGEIEPRANGVGGLRKPSLRITDPDLGLTGTPANPHYLVNSAANLAADPAALLPSNENDYYQGATRAQKVTARAEAATLGKALFWDMQVGSDTVQACGSCHFHAGADNRTKNQTNPNHVGGDLTLQLHGGNQNTDLVAGDFPFHRHKTKLPADT